MKITFSRMFHNNMSTKHTFLDLPGIDDILPIVFQNLLPEKKDMPNSYIRDSMYHNKKQYSALFAFLSTCKKFRSMSPPQFRKSQKIRFSIFMNESILNYVIPPSDYTVVGDFKFLDIPCLKVCCEETGTITWKPRNYYKYFMFNYMFPRSCVNDYVFPQCIMRGSDNVYFYNDQDVTVAKSIILTNIPNEFMDERYVPSLLLYNTETKCIHFKRELIPTENEQECIVTVF